MRLLLSPANAPAIRGEIIKSLSLDFIGNRVLFRPELLIARVLRQLPRLRSLSVEASIHENRIVPSHGYSPFPRDALFWLSPFATSIKQHNILYHLFLSLRRLNEYSRLDPDLAVFFASEPEILDLELRGIPYSSDSSTLPPSALPHLETLCLAHD